MRRLLATICLIFLCSSSAYASGFSIYEASVRANGMLGAFSAYADHVSTIYYNPAGLGGLDGIRISGGATVIAPRSSFRGPLPSSTPYPGSQLEYEMDEQNFVVPNLYASYELTNGLTAGLGIYAPFGLGTRWDQDWVGRTEAIETSVQTIFVQPTIGYAIPDFGIGNIKLGAGLMVAAYGNVKLSRAVESFAVDNDIFALDGQLEKPGLGYNVGVLYEPNEMLTFGFTYRSEVETEFSGDANFGDLPTAYFPTNTEGGTTLDLPSNWVAAVNYQHNENLSLEVDFLWWGWSSYDELAIDFNQEITAFEVDNNPLTNSRSITSPRNYNNSWQVRIGGEYTDLLFDGLTLRAGAAYDKTPLPIEHIDPTLPDANRWEVSGGISVDVTDQIAIDAAYIFIQSRERTNRESVNEFHGVYNTYANLPSLGLTMKL